MAADPSAPSRPAGEWPWPAPADDGAADHLAPCTQMPVVALPATTGGAVDLSCTAGRVIVFVYPWTGRPVLDNPPGWDDIPGAHGSTPQAQGYAALHDAFVQLGATVYGLSTQETGWQQEFAARLGLPYALLSDAELAFADALGLPRFATGGVTYLRRLTLAVRDGAIEHVWYPAHPPDANAREVLAWLAATVDYATEMRPRSS